MSVQHCGVMKLKPISEVAKFQRNLIPANIPETYKLKSMFESVASEESIRNGIVAFRDFLLILCDRLISDGDVYAKPPKNPSGIGDYPFLYCITNLLVDIGYHGKLSENGDSLSVAELPLCIASVDEKGKKISPKISASALFSCVELLTLCGFCFSGVDLEVRKLNISETQPLKVSFPSNPLLTTGLKAMSIAEMELRTTRRYWNDNNFLRCDYRLLKAEDSDMRDVLVDFLYPLPKEIQGFALQLHERYTNMGLTCVNTRLGLVSFAYAYIGKSRKLLSEREIYSKRVWKFSYSLKDGYCLFARPKKTERYADVIKTFDVSLQKKIAQGYGCYRKLGRNRCQFDCQGIRIPLNEQILAIGGDIEAWFDQEIPKH